MSAARALGGIPAGTDVSTEVAEQVFGFDCEDSRLLGILSTPAQPASRSGVGVVVVVGGPQYRVGSHRQFVLLARSLAAAGHACLRFDGRGMGDSEGEPQGFESSDAEIHAAMRALRAHAPWTRRIVLWGLCDGASASLLYLHRQGSRAGVHALCLLNPWVRSSASLARTHVKHYYADRLMQRDFWLKLLRGGVAIQALRGLLGNLRRAMAPTPVEGSGGHPPFPVAMARAWKAFDGPMLLVLSGQDLTAREFEDVASTSAEWKGATGRANVARKYLPAADHTFSQDEHRRELEAICLDWLKSCTGSEEAGTHHEQEPDTHLRANA